MTHLGTTTQAQPGEAGPTAHAARHATTTHAATSHEGERTPAVHTAGGPDPLPHTGAGETGLIAGPVATLMAAGAGIAALARRGQEEDEQAAPGSTS